MEPAVTMTPGAGGALTSSGKTSASSEEYVRSSFLGSTPAGTASETTVVHVPSAVSLHGRALSIVGAATGALVATGAGDAVGAGPGSRRARTPRTADRGGGNTRWGDRMR